MAKRNYEVCQFVNDLNQVIQPGDSVISVASGFGKTVNVNRAVFLGTRATPSGKIRPVVLINETVRTYVDLEGKPTKWNYAKYQNKQIKHGEVNRNRQSTLRLGRIYLTPVNELSLNNTVQPSLSEKVEQYEALLHKIQLLCTEVKTAEVGAIVKNICDWSVAHRSWNGEIDNQRVTNAFNKLLKTRD